MHKADNVLTKGPTMLDCIHEILWTALELFTRLLNRLVFPRIQQKSRRYLAGCPVFFPLFFLRENRRKAIGQPENQRNARPKEPKGTDRRGPFSAPQCQGLTTGTLPVQTSGDRAVRPSLVFGHAFLFWRRFLRKEVLFANWKVALVVELRHACQERIHAKDNAQ